MEREQQLLVDWIRAAVRPGAAAPPSPPAPTEALALRELIRAQRIGPTLVPVMREAGLPAEWLQPLEAEFRAVALRNAGLLLELAQVVRALEQADAHPVVLKGPALRITHYGRRERMFSDLDVLVDLRRREAAYDALRTLGYRFSPTDRHARYYERYHFHRILDKPGVVVETHWDLSRPDDYYRPDLTAFRSRCRRVESQGDTFRVPSDLDHLLHAAIQLLQDGFFDLRRILDAALILDGGAVETGALVREARRAGLAHAVWLLLRLTDLIAGVAPPAGALEALRPGSLRRSGLRCLGLPARLVAGRDRHAFATSLLARAFAAPSAGRTLRELGRHAAPSEYQFLERGMHPDRLPGLGGRAFFALKRTLDLAKVASFLVWRVAVRSPGGSALPL